MSARFDVAGFGEIMLRLSVPAEARLETAVSLDVHPGGAEGNVVCNLGALGRSCAWVGALPRDPLGALVRNHLRRANVCTEGVIWKEHSRIGTFYVELGGAPRGVQVYYDRAGSAASQVGPEELPWDILLSTSILHISGITPALSESCLRATQEIISRAQKAGVALSFDVNYRRKLWDAKKAASVLLPLIQEVELLFCARADAQQLFGCSGDPEECIASLADRTRAKNIVVSLGEAGAIAWDGNAAFRAAQRPVTVIDRIGAGDAMAAGVLHGWLKGDLHHGLEAGMALASLALSIKGDVVYTSPAELESIVAGGEQGPNR